ncbi:helix-turn-helix transcriptional regulator [Microbacterium paludicola]|uniref:helix-turn-helix transcriptional regulator n=1 Tax=Microbacterium paludicola TaxID=300019 RepID=UPI0011A76400|nr:helix-turn-helix transcriptional regulator [Microbacterium paludicola]
MRQAEGWGDYVERLGAQLHRRRIAEGMSQETVAYRAGITRFTYQSYEKGKSQSGAPANPSLRSVIALAEVLNIPLNEILPARPPHLSR